MPLISIIATATLGVFVVMSSASPADQPHPHKRRIRRLIANLGHSNYRTRRQAQRELRDFGELILPELRRALNDSDAELRIRVRDLCREFRSETFHTISREGRLYRLRVGKQVFVITPLVRLPPPLKREDVRVTGLVSENEQTLLAAVVFRSGDQRYTELIRIKHRTGTAIRIGRIVKAPIAGLHRDRRQRLFGVIPSCRQSSAVSLTQFIEIDPQTAKPSSTDSTISLGNATSLAIDPNGLAFIANGSNGLFGLPTHGCHAAEPLFLGKRHRKDVRANGRLEGLCIGRYGGLYGLCGGKKSRFVRIDMATGRILRTRELPFAAFNLAAFPGESPDRIPVSAPRPRVTTQQTGTTR